MEVKLFILTVVLFYLLTPGMYLTLPEDGTKNTVAIVHAVIFTIVYMVILQYAGQYLH
jgi:hypothetical protein